VQQQAARPPGLVVEAVGLQILGDVGVEQEQLVAGRARVGLADGRLALRSDFTSVPVSAMPASRVSTIS